MTTPPQRRTLFPHLLLFGVVFVWGTTFPLVKAALRDVSPLLFNFLRMSLAAALLLALNRRALRGLTRAELVRTAVVGMLLAFGYQLQTTGLALTTPTRSAFLTGLVVVLVPLLSMIPRVAVPGFGRPGTSAFAGAFAAFAGVVLLTSGPASAHKATSSGFGLGEWLTMGCALAFAAHLLSLARVAPAIPARQLGTLQISFAALVMLVTLPFERSLVFRPTATVVSALVITSVLATAAAFTIQSWAQERLPASHVALLFTLEPVFAWLTSLAFLGERLSPRSLAGAALILLGILVVELWPAAGRGRPVPLDAASLS